MEDTMKESLSAVEKPHFQQAIQSTWLKEVDEFVWTNISRNDLTISDIACAIYTSERQFYRKIKK